MSLRWKILLPFFLLGAALTLGTVLAVGRLTSQSDEDRSLRILADASQQAADALVRSEDQLISFQRLLLNSEGVSDAVASASSESLRASVLPLAIFSDVDLAAVLDAEGTSLLVVRKPNGASPGEYETLRGESYFADWEFVQRTLAGEEDAELGDKQVGLEMILLGDQEQAVFFVSGPVRDSQGRPIGGVLVGAYLDRLAEEVAEQAGPSVSFYGNASGELLASTLEPVSSDDLTLEPDLRESMANPGGVVPVRTISIAGTPYRESLIPFTARQGKETLGAIGVSLLAADPGAPDGPAVAEWLLPYLLGGWLIAAIAGWVVASRIAGRLRRLAESPTLVAESGGDEIATLSRSWSGRMAQPARPADVRPSNGGGKARDLHETQPAIRLGVGGGIFRGPVTALSLHIHPPPSSVGEETGLLAEAVRDLVRTLPEIIERHRGVAVSLDEIGLVALFGLSPRGVPVAVSALLAGHAALAIGEHVSGITLGGEENGKLTMSAGLDTGDVLAFPVGGMDHRTWVGLGGTLEVAKALDTLGKNNAHGGLAMSGSAYEALAAARQQFEFGRYGRVRLGNPGPEMMVYEVIGRKASLVRHRTASL